MIGVGERVPAATVWVTPRDEASLTDVADGAPFLLLFYLFDWSST